MRRILDIGSVLLSGLVVIGCQQGTQKASPAGAGMQAMPVKTVAVALQPVAQSSEYVATIKSRRSATMLPQVNGRLTEILVHSGDHVKAGQVLMEIDPRQQQATVAAQRATERQKKALLDYNTIELDRQHKLFDAGVTSRDAMDQAQQAFDNAKADYESAVERARRRNNSWATTRSARRLTALSAIFRCTWATTFRFDGDNFLRADHGGREQGSRSLHLHSHRARRPGAHGSGCGPDRHRRQAAGENEDRFSFAQVDTTLQGILAKAPVHPTPEILRNAQLVKARVIWSTKPMAVVPVLAVTRQGGQPFVYVVRKQQNGQYIAPRHR